MSLPGGAHWDEEQGRLVQIFTEYCKILCSVLSDEAVPEEGAGISGLYLEGARWYEEQGRAYQVLFIRGRSLLV